MKWLSTLLIMFGLAGLTLSPFYAWMVGDGVYVLVCLVGPPGGKRHSSESSAQYRQAVVDWDRSHAGQYLLEAEKLSVSEGDVYVFEHVVMSRVQAVIRTIAIFVGVSAASLGLGLGLAFAGRERKNRPNQAPHPTPL